MNISREEAKHLLNLLRGLSAGPIHPKTYRAFQEEFVRIADQWKIANGVLKDIEVVLRAA